MSDLLDFAAEVLLPFVAVIVLFIGLICAIVLPLGWISSCRSADVFNRQHGTSWTCSDFFWAGEQINAQSQTINLNTSKL